MDVSTHKLYFVASSSFSSLFARGLSNLFVELWLKISNCQICNIMRYLDYHKYQQNYSSFLFTNYIYLMKILACIKQQNHVFLFFFRIKFYDLEQVKYSFKSIVRKSTLYIINNLRECPNFSKFLDALASLAFKLSVIE